ncbi:unnamed protein product [Rhodiola kirilowii]
MRSVLKFHGQIQTLWCQIGPKGAAEGKARIAVNLEIVGGGTSNFVEVDSLPDNTTVVAAYGTIFLVGVTARITTRETTPPQIPNTTPHPTHNTTAPPQNPNNTPQPQTPNTTPPPQNPNTTTSQTPNTTALSHTDESPFRTFLKTVHDLFSAYHQARVLAEALYKKMKQYKRRMPKAMTLMMVSAIGAIGCGCGGGFNEALLLAISYLWSDESGKRVVHWIGMDIILKGKVEGGLGLRDLELFNRVLLMKQLWLILKYPELLVSKLLRAKYFNNSNVLQASLGGVYRWKLSGTGEFCCKTTYKMVFEQNLRLSNLGGESSNSEGMKNFREGLWKLNLVNKIKLFTWSGISSLKAEIKALKQGMELAHRLKVIMEIPVELMITISKKLPWMFFLDIVPIGHPIFDIINSTNPETDWDLRLACLLLLAFDQEENFWQLYGDFLPSADECTSLLLASQDDLSELQDQNLASTMREQHRRALEFWERNWHSAVPLKIKWLARDPERFIWAVAIAQSRCINMQMRVGSLVQDANLLIPYADMMNHSFQPNCFFHWRHKDRMFEVMINAGQQIKKGDENTLGVDMLKNEQEFDRTHRPLSSFQCYRMPKYVCDELLRVALSYMWSDESGKRVVHWIRMEIILKGKVEGCLGLRDLELFNMVLLMKQLWLILKYPELLVSKLLRAKEGKVYRWKLSGTGKFCCKTAYKMVFKQNLRLSNLGGERSNSEGMQNFCKGLWKLNFLNEIKFFMWRCFYNGLPDAGNLWKICCEIELECGSCGYGIEHVLHIFKKCWKARAIWRELDIEETVIGVDCENIADLLWFCARESSMKKFRALACGCLLLWFDRNQRRYGRTGMQGGGISSLEAEIKALKQGMELAHRLKVLKAVIYSDSFEAIWAIYKGSHIDGRLLEGVETCFKLLERPKSGAWSIWLGKKIESATAWQMLEDLELLHPSTRLEGHRC